MQNSYDDNLAPMRRGQAQGLFNDKRTSAAFARGFVKAGYAAFDVPGLEPGGSSPIDPGSVYQAPVPAAAADADAIAATIASAAATQTLSGASLDGTVGATEVYPPRKISLTLSSHADWDLSDAVFTFYDENGQLTTETFAIPDGGNATVTGEKYMSRFVSASFDAQSGTGGTATIGLQVLDASVTLADVRGVVLYHPIQEPASADAEFGDGDDVDCLEEGDVAAYCETAMPFKSAVYVRVAGDNLGAFRADADGGDAVLVPDARVIHPTTAAGPCHILFKR